MQDEAIVELPVDQRTITRRYTDRAIDFIQQNRDQPFFLYLPHSMPHIPLYVPDDVYDPNPQNAYTCVIEHIDAQVGRIADTVRDLKLADRTFIIYTSDNGPWLQFKNHGGSADPLRAGKGTTFEGGQRVPCVMWAPGRIPAGTQTDAMTSTVDLLPTVASLSGKSLPADRRIDGYDISQTFTSDESPRDEFVFYSSPGELEGIRMGKWKFLQKEKPRSKKPEVLLFDLAEDVGEQVDQPQKYPEKVAAMRQRMREIDGEITANARPVWQQKPE